MILDQGRLLNILPTLPEDIQDTVADLLAKVELDLEYEKCLRSDIEVLEKAIEELKKQMALDKQAAPPQIPQPGPGRYIAQGNTYPIKDLLKGWGFKWNATEKHWFLPDLGKSSEEAVFKVRHILKEQNNEDAEIVFVAGK